MPLYDDLTTTQHANIGTLPITKGSDGQGNPILSWDPVKNCNSSLCPAVLYCPYNKAQDFGTKCRSELLWIKAFTALVHKNYPGLTEWQKSQIGTIVGPAFQELHKLYLAELGVRNTTFLNNSGSWKVHPIYAELRKHRTHIMNLFKDIGLTGFQLPNKPFRGNEKSAGRLRNPNMDDLTIEAGNQRPKLNVGG